MKNTYAIVGDKVYIDLNQGLQTIIDIQDFNIVNEYSGTWYAQVSKVNYYVYIHVYDEINKRKRVALHRAIMQVNDSDVLVDHRNHQTLDNTRDNLRLCTNSENQMNSRMQINRSSQYKGVSWQKQKNKWRAFIQFQKQSLYLGSFIDEIEAAKTYDDKAKELFGEYAFLNFPDK